MSDIEAKHTCARVREQLAMMLYGELSFDEEEVVETHLDTCAECRGALERQRELHAAFDRVEVEPPPSLLRECRAALGAQLAGALDVPPSTSRTSGPRPVWNESTQSWWDKVVSLVTGPLPSGWLRPAGAATLVAVGFFGAQILPRLTSGSGLASMGMTDVGSAHVRNVEPEANGQVQIVVDETRQKVISGGLEDQQIRAMLLAAARESMDPGVRAATVELLNPDAASADVRAVLISALRHDQNAGVRLKAMEGLRQFAQDPSVRRTFAEVLLSDGNPGVRTQMIDLLTQGLGPSVDRDLVGAFQELMMKEENPYVRERCQSVLASWNASSEIY
jgi:anti-sigma factor RsiW